MRRYGLMVLLIGLTLAGCNRNRGTTRPVMTAPLGKGDQQAVYEEVTAGTKISPRDQLRCLVEVIEITVPAGTLSKSQEFWRIINASGGEQRNELLSTNGIRLGIFELNDWPDAKRIINSVPEVVTKTSSLRGPGKFEISSREVNTQTVFYFASDGQLHGRSFDESANILGVSFNIDANRRDMIDMEVAPLVRSLRKQMRISRTSGEYAMDYVQPEMLYDLGISAKLPTGTTLVIAPTNEGLSADYSVGQAFFIFDQNGGLMEKVVLLHPRIYRLTDKKLPAPKSEEEKAEQAEQKSSRQAKRSR